MLEFKTMDNGETSLCVCGTIQTIASDTVLMIKLIYEKLASDKKLAGEVFKKVVTDAITDGLPFMTDETMEMFVETLGEKNVEGE